MFDSLGETHNNPSVLRVEVANVRSGSFHTDFAIVGKLGRATFDALSISLYVHFIVGVKIEAATDAAARGPVAQALAVRPDIATVAG